MRASTALLARAAAHAAASSRGVRSVRTQSFSPASGALLRPAEELDSQNGDDDASAGTSSSSSSSVLRALDAALSKSAAAGDPLLEKRRLVRGAGAERERCCLARARARSGIPPL